MENEFKRASWLELFYDVAFVALVAQLTYLAFEYHDSVQDLLNLFVIGYVIFIAWWSTTANRNLQPTETASDKLFIQIQMIGAFLMSLTMPGVFEGDYTGFFVTFAALRLAQSFMLIRMYVMHPQTRPVTYNILGGFLAATILWFVAGMVPIPYHYIVLAAALAIEVLTPLTRGKGNTKRYLNVHHLQERLGLFLMLVIGESMIVVALSNTAASLSAVEPAVVFSGLGLMIALWWLYFEHSDDHAGVRPNNLALFLHSHGFLFGSIILLSIGYKLMVADLELLTAFSFITAGVTGISLTLTAIRIASYGTTKKVIMLTLLVSIPGFAIAMLGYLTGHILTAILSYTVWYLCIAYLDHQGLFESHRAQNRTLNASS